MILPGDGRRLMQFVHINDLVAACVKAIDTPDIEGHAFNIANPRPLTQVEAVEAFARAAGKEPTFVRLPRERILRAGGHPMGPKMYFGVYFDLPAITVVVNKAQRILKFKPVEFNAGLKETLSLVRAAQVSQAGLCLRRRAHCVGAGVGLFRAGGLMVSVQEYLTSSYEADREYVDGELLERHSGEQPHTRVHGVVASLLFRREREAGVRVLMSQRVQVSPTRFRVPDVCAILAL